MRAHRVSLAALAALPIVAVTANTVSATPSTAAPTYKDLVYVNGVSSYDLWTANADGSGQALLPKSKNNNDTSSTNTPAVEWSPVIDSVSGQIAFESRRSGSADVWVQNMTTGALRQVTTSSNTEAPAGWYRDASAALRILFYGGADGSQLLSMRPDGTDQRLVANTGANFGRATVSRSGTVAVPADLGDGLTRVYTFAIDPNGPVATSGWTPVTLPPAGLKDSTPTFAPNGDLVFGRYGDGVGRLMRLAAGTTESSTNQATLLLKQSDDIVNPSFSPSHPNEVAYSVNYTTSATTGYQVAIGTVNGDGSVTTLTTFGTNASQPVWRN